MGIQTNALVLSDTLQKTLITLYLIFASKLLIPNRKITLATLKLQLSVSRTKENIYLTSHLHTQSCLDQALNKLNSFKIKNEISDEIQGWHGHHPPLGRLPTDRQAEK